MVQSSNKITELTDMAEKKKKVVVGAVFPVWEIERDGGSDLY